MPTPEEIDPSTAEFELSQKSDSYVGQVSEASEVEDSSTESDADRLEGLVIQTCTT